MTGLPALPDELDPDYRPPEEPIAAMVAGRRPRAGEWVNCHRPSPSGQRGGLSVLTQVLEVREDGCLVRPWQRERMAFGEPFFSPWICVVSRAAVTRYSLMGEEAADC